MIKHLELNNILHALQHGFRKYYSCETQLISLFQDLASNPSQIDLIIMDFSKAFDKVPHRRLDYTLDWYGIRGNTREWTLDFLSGMSQRVVLEGGIIWLGTCSLWCSPGHRSGTYPVPPVHKWPHWCVGAQYGSSLRRRLYCLPPHQEQWWHYSYAKQDSWVGIHVADAI